MALACNGASAAATAAHWLALMQTNDRLKQSKDAVPLLCVQTQHGSIAEVDTAASGVLDTECLAHKHQHLKTSQVMAPKLEYMQQVARGAGDAGSVVPEAADALSATPMAALHDLYEWIGAVSCGIHGQPCICIQTLKKTASALQTTALLNGAAVYHTTLHT